MDNIKTNAEILSDARTWVAEINAILDADEFRRHFVTSPFLDPWTRDITIGELDRRELRWREVAPNPSARLRCLQVVHSNNLLEWPHPTITMIRVRPDNLFEPPTRAAMLEELERNFGSNISIGDIIKIDSGWAVAISEGVEIPETIHGFNLRQLSDREIAELPPSTQTGPRNVSVTSPRIDAVASKTLNPSREQIKKHLSSGGVLLNYQPARKPGQELVPGDIVSVRTGGKFRFIDISDVSKKGRMQIKVEILSGP